MWYRHHAQLVLGITAGYFIGSAIPDPKTFGLDAIFPAILIALTFSALKNKVTQKLHLPDQL